MWLGQYLYYDSPDNGDMHVLVPGRFLAFRGPRDYHGDWLDASSYVNVFRRLSVHTVVRLNKPDYDKAVFTSAGFEHLDLLFEDCTVPPLHIVDAFLRAAEDLRPGQMIAVHCLAGLGRTGTLIGLFMMKHFGFSANEAIGWLRICRPGSVIGPQQQFLADEEERMHRLGAEQTPGLGDDFEPLSPVSSYVSPHSFRETSKILADMVTDGMMNRSERRLHALGEAKDNLGLGEATARRSLLPWLQRNATKPPTSLKRSNSETFTKRTTTADQDQANSKGRKASQYPHHSRSYKGLPGLTGNNRYSGIESLKKTGSFNNISRVSSFNHSSSFSRRTSFISRRSSNSSISSQDDCSKHTASEPPTPERLPVRTVSNPLPVGSKCFGGLAKLHRNVPSDLLQQIMDEELASESV